ncbi:lipopolysaccharide biosynthesis protein RfbH [Candidatus Micrarchaeota archaeon CG10_big_fil_rev_8_21_14_0_10_45_29]|nr:MAG: lipopolysaccharide biosynthesis protein RfbH [Candidatus Micrarchaeota archaeon CG10_big_fil_rev_8_21_14_0_10_45_29]
MDKEKELREKILKLTKQYYETALQPKQYKKGDRIPYSGRVFDEGELVSLIDSSLDFWLTAGRYHEQFEKSLASWWGLKFCTFSNSGSSANLLALTAFTSRALGKNALKKGDEVITTAAGFPTTVNPIYQNGCTPVFLDTEVGTYNIDCTLLEEAIGKNTKAIMIAHTLGNPFNLDKITKFAKKHGLFLIEDCCDALGATWDNKKTGTFGEIATTSFYPAHHITTGEGGATLTSNAILHKAIESFRDWGRDCWCPPGKADTCNKRFKWQLGTLPFGYDHKYIYSNIGYNLKATDMQAAIGVAQLQKLPSFIEARKKNFEWYMKNLQEYEQYFIFPKKEAKANPSPFGFILTVKEDAPFSRNDIVQFLEKKSISTRMLFGGNLTRQPAYINAPKRIVGELAGADTIMNNSFWIGVYPGLNNEMLEYISGAFAEFIKSKK